MKNLLALAVICLAMVASADDIVTLDGQKYNDVRDVTLKSNGLFFVVGEGSVMQGVTIPYDNLPEDVKERYHYDPYEMGMLVARQNNWINLSTNLAFSLDNLDAAKKKAAAGHKMIGFILEWDSFFVRARPMGRGSNDALAQFYDVFHNGLVLVFVRHENELDKVPDAVKQGLLGPEEGGFAPCMTVVTSDCSQFVCHIPYGKEDETGLEREQIFQQKIAVMKNFKPSP